MHSYAVIPPVLLPYEERRRKFTSNNGLIMDPLKDFNDRKFQNMWSDAEKEIFREKFLQHPKNFGLIAQSLERKSVSDCVQYYYLTKKTANYKQQLRRAKVRGRGRGRAAAAGAAADRHAAVDNDGGSEMVIGVMTRRQRGQDGEDNSNRSTPQPSNLKQELKQEPEEDRSVAVFLPLSDGRSLALRPDSGDVIYGARACA